MANSIQLIEKYLTNTVDTVFALESKTNILENGQKFVDVNFKEAGYVRVMSLLMDGLSDYYRVNNGTTGSNYTHYPQGDGYKVGNVNAKWELFQLQYDRGKQFQIDSQDDEETAGLIIGNLLTEFLRTKVVPEVDAVRFSKLASKCSATLGNLKSETISANTIIANFNSAFEWLTEHEVPSEDQVIFVNPIVMTQIRNTTELYKKLSQAEYKGDVSFTIDTYEGRPIIEVPSNRFITDVEVGVNGFYAGSNSKLINYIVCSKRAVVPIVKLQKSKIWTPDSVQDFDGYKVNFRLYHDVIIPKNKIAGVYTSVSSSVAGSTKSNLLAVDVEYVDTATFKVNEYFTIPAGILGAKLIYSNVAIAVGSTYASAATNKEITVGTAFTVFGNGDTVAYDTAGYFALVDANNAVVASTGSITLPTE